MMLIVFSLLSFSFVSMDPPPPYSGIVCGATGLGMSLLSVLIALCRLSSSGDGSTRRFGGTPVPVGSVCRGGSWCGECAENPARRGEDRPLSAGLPLHSAPRLLLSVVRRPHGEAVTPLHRHATAATVLTSSETTIRTTTTTTTVGTMPRNYPRT